MDSDKNILNLEQEEEELEEDARRALGCLGGYQRGVLIAEILSPREQVDTLIFVATQAADRTDRMELLEILIEQARAKCAKRMVPVLRLWKG